MLEDRREDDESVHDWLRIVRDRGGDAPIIVAINKSDRGKADLRLPERDLKRDYPQIVDVVRTSCDPDEFARASIDALRDLIARTLLEHPELKHVHDPIPLSWLRVKERIAALAADTHVIETSTFFDLCQHPAAEKGETLTPIGTSKWS